MPQSALNQYNNVVYQKLQWHSPPVFSSFTSLGIPIMSSHCLLEYCSFAQHWRSMSTILLESKLLTFFVTHSSDWSLSNLSFNFRISSSNSVWSCCLHQVYFVRITQLGSNLSCTIYSVIRYCKLLFVTQKYQWKAKCNYRLQDETKILQRHFWTLRRSKSNITKVKTKWHCQIFHKFF